MLGAFPDVTPVRPAAGYSGPMNTRIVLARRPVGWVEPACFALESIPEPDLPPEGVLLQAVYLSLDPYLRGRMNEGPSYAPGFALGRPIVSRVVARVLASRHAAWREGDDDNHGYLCENVATASGAGVVRWDRMAFAGDSSLRAIA